MYAREIDGREFTFGVSGKLLRNTLVMYDHQTASEWGQVLGEALTGPMTGTKLEVLAASHWTWKEWRDLHPETLALEKPDYLVRDPYETYYESDDAGIIGETVNDDRLGAKEHVIGVLIGETPVAYSYEALGETPVLNDVVGESELLITFDVDTRSVAVFDRTIGGKILTFTHVENDDALIKDVESGTTWNKLTGQAIAGPLNGSALTQMPFTTAFWFGWKDNFPETLVYGE